jgi:hypothetical protein
LLIHSESCVDIPNDFFSFFLNDGNDLWLMIMESALIPRWYWHLTLCTQLGPALLGATSIFLSKSMHFYIKMVLFLFKAGGKL